MYTLLELIDGQITPVLYHRGGMADARDLKSLVHYEHVGSSPIGDTGA